MVDQLSPSPQTELTDCHTPQQNQREYFTAVIKAWVDQGDAHVQEGFRSLVQALSYPENMVLQPFDQLLDEHLNTTTPQCPRTEYDKSPHMREKLKTVWGWIDQGDQSVRTAFINLLQSQSSDTHCERFDPALNSNEKLRKYLEMKAETGGPGDHTEPKLETEPMLKTESKAENAGEYIQPSFPLTITEFFCIVESLAENGEVLGTFGEHLDLSKDDFHMGSNLRPLHFAQKLVTKYQYQPGATRKKLINALRKVGLGFIADIVALTGTKLE